MAHDNVLHDIKRVGSSGQFTLGKEYAGKLMRVEKLEEGGFKLTPVVDVPESEAWIFEEPNFSRIKRALAWMDANPARETDLNAFFEQHGIESEGEDGDVAT